ncbi:MAG: rod shape-determining protein MreD [Clostridia bacterium]|nr:rod shape-determining protein MreD [Clostridia bacterium]
MPYYLTMFLLGGLGLVLEATLFSQFTIAGVKPDLLLILIIFNCLFQDSSKGGFFGFFLGLFEDLYLGSYIGMNALTKGLTSFLGSRLLQGAFRENLLVPVIAIFLGSMFNGMMIVFLGKLVGLNWGWNLFYWKVLPMAIYNTCLVPFVYSGYYHWVDQDPEQQSL